MWCVAVDEEDVRGEEERKRGSGGQVLSRTDRAHTERECRQAGVRVRDWDRYLPCR